MGAIGSCFGDFVICAFGVMICSKLPKSEFESLSSILSILSVML